MNFLASWASIKDFHFAVGIPCLSIKAFDQSLSDSILAAFFWGPKTLIPSANKASAIPFARGSSGPTATRDICLSLQIVTISLKKSTIYLGMYNRVCK